MIDVFLACIKLGLIFVPINILYRDREITHILADAEPAALITDAELSTNIPVWLQYMLIAKHISSSRSRRWS